jgi:hypothetical protein
LRETSPAACAVAMIAPRLVMIFAVRARLLRRFVISVLR